MLDGTKFTRGYFNFSYCTYYMLAFSKELG